MSKSKRAALEAPGSRVGDAANFPELSQEEAKLVELRGRVSQAIRRRRESRCLTQRPLATILTTSQRRVAKIESAARDVSLAPMFRSLYALGGNLNDVGEALPTDKLGEPRPS